MRTIGRPRESRVGNADAPALTETPTGFACPSARRPGHASTAAPGSHATRVAPQTRDIQVLMGGMRTGQAPPAHGAHHRPLRDGAGRRARLQPSGSWKSSSAQDTPGRRALGVAQRPKGTPTARRAGSRGPGLDALRERVAGVRALRVERQAPVCAVLWVINGQTLRIQRLLLPLGGQLVRSMS